MADIVLNFGFGWFYSENAFDPFNLCQIWSVSSLRRSASTWILMWFGHDLSCTVSFSEHSVTDSALWTQASIVTATPPLFQRRESTKAWNFHSFKPAEPTPSKHEHNAGKMRLLQLVSYWSAQHWSPPIGKQGQKHLQKTVSQALAT